MNPELKARIKARKNLVYERLGDDAKRILEEAGLDVDRAMTRIIRQQEEEQAMLKLKTVISTVDNTMTSELVCLSQNPDDTFGEEYTRRLGSISVPPEQITTLYQEEKQILGSFEIPGRQQPWAQRYFLFPTSTLENLPKIEHLTLSELLMITDDANSAIVRDHHAIKGPAFQAVCIAACNRHGTEARYAHAFNNRTQRLGWSEEQKAAFCKNEFGLTEKLKWGYHNDDLWTPETTNLEQYMD